MYGQHGSLARVSLFFVLLPTVYAYLESPNICQARIKTVLPTWSQGQALQVP